MKEVCVPCAVYPEIIELNSYGFRQGLLPGAQQIQGQVQKQNPHLDVNAMDWIVFLPFPSLPMKFMC